VALFGLLKLDLREFCVRFNLILDTEWAREWDKANNCKDIVYKLEIVE